MKWVLGFLFAVMASSASLSAGIAVGASSNVSGTWKKFDEEVKNKVEEIKWLAFGPVMRIVGMLAIVYAIISAFVTHSMKQLYLFGVMGLLMTMLPTFIDSLFSAVLP